MRYVVLGAGAIGSAIGGRLHEHGHEVCLIARGEHLEALRTRGLELRDPDRTVVLDVPVAADPSSARIGEDDVVVLATKTQQSEAALLALAATAPPFVPVVCAQNGVENERLALRRFKRVQAMCVILPATHMEPGIVEIPVAPVTGILDVGRYPSGTDDVSAEVARALSASTFDARSDPNVMAAKYLKLLSNLANAIEAALGSRTRSPGARELHDRAKTEALACFAAAGIEVADDSADLERRRGLGRLRPVGGNERSGGSSFQSLARATGNIEADWLNGEIAYLGRLHGVPTPVNERLQLVANQMAREGRAPGSLDEAELMDGLEG